MRNFEFFSSLTRAKFWLSIQSFLSGLSPAISAEGGGAGQEEELHLQHWLWPQLLADVGQLQWQAASWRSSWVSSWQATLSAVLRLQEGQWPVFAFPQEKLLPHQLQWSGHGLFWNWSSKMSNQYHQQTSKRSSWMSSKISFWSTLLMVIWNVAIDWWHLDGQPDGHPECLLMTSG